MNVLVLAEWLRRQGHRVIRTPSSYWVDAGPRIYQAIPYHQVIEPDEKELTQFLRSHNALGLRYSCPVASQVGTISYHVVYKGDDYSLVSLPKKARYDVRKALHNADVKPITFARQATEGWELRAETLERQGRTTAESKAWWQKLCSSADGLPGFEAWGVVLDKESVAEDRLAASLIAFTCDACCSILYHQSRTEYLSAGVNNALAFVFTQQALERPNVDYIFYGLHSLDAPSSVDKFKFRMGYVAQPVRQRVVFHPLLEPAFNRTTHAAIRWLHQRQPENPTLAKAEGMLRFYRQGKRPLGQQSWPESIADQRAGLLGTSSP